MVFGGDGDRQKTPHGHPDFNSHVKTNVFSYSREFSGKHSFTLHPSLSPYWRTESQRNKYTCCAWAGGTFFPVVVLCQFLVLAGNRFWFYILMYLEYNTFVELLHQSFILFLCEKNRKDTNRDLWYCIFICIFGRRFF